MHRICNLIAINSHYFVAGAFALRTVGHDRGRVEATAGGLCTASYLSIICTTHKEVPCIAQYQVVHTDSRRGKTVIPAFNPGASFEPQEQEITMNHLLQIARATAFAGLMTGCIVWSAAAFAADSDAPPQGRITVREVDFTSARAVAHLKQRLRHVAMDACMPNAGGRIVMTRDEQACYDTALKDGLAQIESRRQQALRERSVRLADTQTHGNSAN
jgi:UrcA family protein